MDQEEDTIVQLTAEIVSAYVSNNSIRREDLAALIGDVHSALRQAPAAAEVPAEPQEPAVPIRRSITPDYIVCLEDGKKFKSLKRHLRTDHDMSPDEYRAKWNLRSDYPMVAPNYAKARSELARSMGLGQKRAAAAAAQAAAAAEGAPAPKRGRKPRAAK